MNKKVLLLIPIVVAIVVGAAYLSGSFGSSKSNVQASSVGGCLPTDVSSLANAKFPIKQPSASSLPAGYQLRGIDDSTFVATLYYSDKPICKAHEFSEEIGNGTLVIMESHNEFLDNETAFAEQNANGVISDTDGKVQATLMDINGHKAVVIPQHMGTDRVMIAGKIVEDTPLRMPAEVLVFDSSQKLQYNIAADRPADELIAIAKSIQ